MICRDMKKLHLESLLNALEGKVPEVVMPEEERLSAEGCLQKMLELGK
jgi:quinolinate synthase